VGNPALVVSEVQRVLKPGGIFLFIEHVQAKETGIRIAQNVLNPLQTLVADGCHLNRRSGDIIREYGSEFSVIEIEEFKVDLGFGGEIISTQICGYAMKQPLCPEL
jgi:SAM-dependent methyltransferase